MFHDCSTPLPIETRNITHTKSLPFDWNSIFTCKFNVGAYFGTSSESVTSYSWLAFNGQTTLWFLHKSLSGKGYGSTRPPIFP